MKNNSSCDVAYIKRIESIYTHKHLVGVMRCVGMLAVLFTVAAFCHMLAVSFIASAMTGVKLLAVSAIPFALVTVMRRALNWPRPYQVYDLSSVGIDRPKDKDGCSFPSRHVFSSFLIGVLAIEISLPLAIAVLLLGALLAACRAALAIHFVKDVVFGAILGTVSGLIGLFSIYM